MAQASNDPLANPVTPIQPLMQQFPIVDSTTGKPSDYFMRYILNHSGQITTNTNDIGGFQAQITALQNSEFVGVDGVSITPSSGLLSDAPISIGLTETGVTAGSYTGANVTVDAYGRITLAADGAAALTVEDGTTTVTNVNTIKFSGGTVSTPSSGEALVTISGGGGGGGGSITATIDPSSGSTTRFNSGMSTYELVLSSPISLAIGDYFHASLIINRATALDRGLIASVDGIHGYGVKFQTDGNKVFYWYDGSEHNANSLAYNANDTSSGVSKLDMQMLVDSTGNGNKYYFDVNMYSNINNTGDGSGSRNGNVSMIGNLRLFAITNVSADFVSCKIETQ